MAFTLGYMFVSKTIVVDFMNTTRRAEKGVELGDGRNLENLTAYKFRVVNLSYVNTSSNTIQCMRIWSLLQSLHLQEPMEVSKRHHLELRHRNNYMPLVSGRGCCIQQSQIYVGLTHDWRLSPSF